MVDSDDDANDFTIHDLDHAPPPPVAEHRGGGSAARSASPVPPLPRRSSLPPALRQSLEKASGGGNGGSRSRLWSTDSAPPAVKSIWSDDFAAPPSRRDDGLGADRERPLRERRHSSASVTVTGADAPHRPRSSFLQDVRGLMRSMSPQPPSGSGTSRTVAHHNVGRMPSLDEQSGASVGSHGGDEGDSSVDRSAAAAAAAAVVAAAAGPSAGPVGAPPGPHPDRSGPRPGPPPARAWNATTARTTEDGGNDDPPNPMATLPSGRRVSFFGHSFQATGHASSRGVDLASSSGLSDSPDKNMGNSDDRSVGGDFDYGEPVEAEDAIGLSSSRSSGGLHGSMGRNRTESQGSLGNWSQALSDWSDHSQQKGDVELGADGHGLMASQTRSSMKVAGVQLPRWLPQPPAIHDISARVVTVFFCGCCCGPTMRQLTDRTILGRLNVLIALFSIIPLFVTTLQAFILYFPMFGLERHISAEQSDTPGSSDPTFSVSDTLWNNNGSMLLVGFFSLITACAAVFTWRVVRNVDLLGTIRYLWLLVWILPFFVFSAISLFDRFDTTSVWVNHFWRGPQFAWYRRSNCKPPSTYNTLCTVPIVDNETQWCIDNYNSTQCVYIRDNAQERTIKTLRFVYDFTGIWSFFVIALLLLAVHTLECIISKPLVQKSRENNVPGWLSLPCLGCLALGGFLTFASQSSLSADNSNKESIAWLIGPLYLTTGGCFLVAAVLGWYIANVSILSTMEKRRKLVAVYLFTADMVLLVVLLLGICGLCITDIVRLRQSPVGDEVRGEYACRADYLGGCTGCDDTVDRCPEWSAEDVTAILLSQARSSATVAAVFVCFCFSSIRFGFVMMKRISMYQIAYV